MPDHLGGGAAPHSGLEAQLNVVCNKIELIRNLLKKEADVLLDKSVAA